MGIFKKIVSAASKDLINEGKSLLNQVTSSQMAENVMKKVQENVKKTVSISSSLNNEQLVEKVVMYCPNCGIETDSKFCPECGTKIVRKTGDITETQSSTLPPIPGIPEIPKANTVAPPSIPIKSEIPIKNVDFETSDDNIKKYTTNGVFRIPDGVTNIIDGDACINESETVKEIILPNTLRKIGDDAFKNCSQLKKVKFGNNVERIGESAFWGCPLEQISLPESLVEIGADAFSQYNFDQLVIPDSVVTIGEYAFGWGDHLHNATIGKSAKNYFNQGRRRSGYSLPRFSSRPIFADCGELTELTVRSEVAEYTGAKSLTKVTICDTVKELGQWAFAECPNIEEVVVPDSVTKIGYCAFVNDENLKTIELSDNITEIGEGAFSGTRLKEIVFPKELSKIGRLGGDMYKLRKLDFSKVTRLRVIPEDFLEDCPKVKELVIPMGVTAIEENIGGDNLNNLFLPPTIEEIEELHQMDLNIYCFAPEIDELEPLIGGKDEENNVFHPNHLYVLPQYLDAYKGQQVAEGISEKLLIIDVIPEEFRYYYE